MAVLLIAHDLRVVRRVAHRAAVLHQGRVCEYGATGQLFAAPQHEFTRSIIHADRPLSALLRQRLAAQPGDCDVADVERTTGGMLDPGARG